MKKLSETKNQSFPIISVVRKIVQLFSFIIINFVILELIFSIDLTFIEETLQILPFLHTPRDSWSTGAGLFEYILYLLGQGEFPYFLIGLFILITLFTGRFFCGWVCPTGFIQDLVSIFPKLPKKMGINIDDTLKKLKKYLFIIIFFIMIVLNVFSFSAIEFYTEFQIYFENFLNSPLSGFSLSEFLFYTLPSAVMIFISSMSLNDVFATPFNAVIFIFYIVILGVSIYYPRFYCRVLCPYGAASAYISEYAFLKFTRNPVRCTGRRECGRCEKICPIEIRILDEPYEGFTGNGECNLCGMCKEACPHDAIKLKFN